MKIRKILILATLFTGCFADGVEEPSNVASESNFVRLSFNGFDEIPELRSVTTVEDSEGVGNISFAWEKVTADSEDANEFALIVSDGVKAIPSYDSQSSYNPYSYTGLCVEPLQDEPSHAEFQTVRFYSKSDIEKAVKCYAVSGKTVINEEDKQYSFDFELPSTFVQTQNQDPSFLKDYICMYAASQFRGNETTLSFNHIPATFRFIIDNNSPKSTTLQDVSISISDRSDSEMQIMASSKATVVFELSEDDTELSYDADGYDKVVTVVGGSDKTLNVGDRYTAYSMALPVGSDDAFRDKILNFEVHTSNSGTISYQVSAEDFAEKNAGVFDWIGGKSYTVQISIGGDAGVTGEMTADNSIELVSDASGVCTLKYIDADGKPLEDYADICTLTVDNIASYDDFVDANVAPMHASAIGIYDSEMELISSISIHDLKSEFETPIYTFGVLSDIHLTNDNVAECQDKYQAALTFFNENDVDFTCICGDISEKGTAEEYAVYKQITSTYSPDTPVYTTTGNHDARSRGINHADWKEYTGCDVVFDFSKILPDGRKDHFIFFGMSYWSQTAAYTEEHLNWLETKLSDYKDERCFIITHMFFPEMAGNMNEVYPSTNWLSGALLERLQTMCYNNPNTIWFSGHSHWKWSLQKFDDKSNVYRTYSGRYALSGWSVHVPSCAKPTDSDGQSRVANVEESEGAIIEVYADHIDIHGLDLINLKYLPIATYRLDTSVK